MLTPGLGYELAQAAVTSVTDGGFHSRRPPSPVLEAGPQTQVGAGPPGASLLAQTGAVSSSHGRPSVCVCVLALLLKIPVLCVLGPWLNELHSPRDLLETPASKHSHTLTSRG